MPLSSSSLPSPRHHDQAVSRQSTRSLPAESVGPAATRLLPPAPHPATGAVRLGFVLETAADVRLSVVDVLGREVATVLDGPRAAGRHDVRVETGRLAPGTYLVRAATEAGVVTLPLTVAR